MKTLIATILYISLMAPIYASTGDLIKISEQGESSETNISLSGINGSLQGTAHYGKIALITFEPDQTPTYNQIDQLVAQLESNYSIELQYAFGEYRGVNDDIIVSVNADSGFVVITDNSLMENYVAEDLG